MLTIYLHARQNHMEDIPRYTYISNMPQQLGVVIYRRKFVVQIYWFAPLKLSKIFSDDVFSVMVMYAMFCIVDIGGDTLRVGSLVLC